MLGISTLNRRNNSLLFRVSQNFLALKSLFLSVQTLTFLFSSFCFLYGKPSKNCSHFYTTTHIFTAAKACRPSLRPSLAAVCLWLSLLSVLSSSLTENHALLGWALIWPFRNISCLCFRKLLDSFPSADKTVHWKHRLISSKALWLNLSREYSLYASQYILLLLSALTSSIKTNDPVIPASTHAHATTLSSPKMMRYFPSYHIIPFQGS